MAGLRQADKHCRARRADSPGAAAHELPSQGPGAAACGLRRPSLTDRQQGARRLKLGLKACRPTQTVGQTDSDREADSPRLLSFCSLQPLRQARNPLPAASLPYRKRLPTISLDAC